MISNAFGMRRRQRLSASQRFTKRTAGPDWVELITRLRGEEWLAPDLQAFELAEHQPELLEVLLGSGCKVT